MYDDVSKVSRVGCQYSLETVGEYICGYVDHELVVR